MKKVTDLKRNEVIHCKTKKEAKKILKLLIDNRIIEGVALRYMLDDWDTHKENTCYEPMDRTTKYCSYDWYNSKSGEYTIYPASDFISPIYTIEDLREGKVAMLSNNSYDDTQRVLKAAYPDTNSVYGKYGIFYYWSLKDGDRYYWFNSSHIGSLANSNLPIQSVEEFLKQLNNETMKTKTLNRKQFKQIYDIACSDWKVKLMEQIWQETNNLSVAIYLSGINALTLIDPERVYQKSMHKKIIVPIIWG